MSKSVIEKITVLLPLLLYLVCFRSTTASATAGELSGTPDAVISNQKIYIFQSASDLQTYKIDGDSYVKLRDLAFAFSDTDKKFDVTYDSIRNEITVLFGKSAGPVDYNLNKSPSPPIAVEIFLSVNNKIQKMNAYNIGGSNYFKLNDLSLPLDYSVVYNNAKNEAYISALDISDAWISTDNNSEGFFRIGQSEQELCDVLTELNLPYTLTYCDGFNTDGKEYTKRIYNIGARDLKIGVIDGKVVNIYTEKFSTAEGLKIGDPISKATEIYGEPDLTNGRDFLYNINDGYLVIYSNNRFYTHPTDEPLKAESFYYDFGDVVYYFAGIKEVYFENKSQYLEATSQNIDNPAPAKLWSAFEKKDGSIFYFGQSEAEVVDLFKQYNIKLCPQYEHLKYNNNGAEILSDNSVSFVTDDYGLIINLVNDEVTAIRQSIYSSTKEGLKIGDPIEMIEQIYGSPIAEDFTDAQGFLYKIGDNYLEIRGNNQSGIFIPYYPTVVSNINFISQGDSILTGFYPQIAGTE